METLNKITPREINRHFVIRYIAATDETTRGSLIGAGRYADKFGEHYAAKHFEKAISSPEDKITFKIRGLFTIIFTAR